MHRTAREDVEVQMVDGLAPVLAGIYNRSVSAGSLAADASGKPEEFGHNVRRGSVGELGQRRNVFDRHDQDVTRGLGMHIVYRGDFVVAVHERGGNLAREDLAENAAALAHHFLTKNVHDLVAVLPAASETLIETRIGPGA